MKGLLIDSQTGDLMVKGGTLAVGDITEQVAACVILSGRGEFKEYPLLGAEIEKQLGGQPDPLWCSNARQMLEACGVPVSRVIMEDNQLTIK